MLRLLQIEFQKLWANRASKVLIILSFILPFTIAFVTSIRIDLGFVNLDPSQYGIFDFPFIWHWNAYFASGFKLFFALVAMGMIANEYSNKTLKQNLIDGLSKKEVVLSKFYVIVVYSFLATIGVFIMSLIIGLIYSSYNEFGIILKDIIFLFAYFLKLVAFFSLCLFVTMLAKRSIFSIGILLIWSLVEWIFYGLIRWEWCDAKDCYKLAESITQFFPLMSMYNLIEQPFIRYGQKVSPQEIPIEYNYTVHWHEIAIVLVWTAIFIFLSYKLLQKRDL